MHHYSKSTSLTQFFDRRLRGPLETSLEQDQRKIRYLKTSRELRGARWILLSGFLLFVYLGFFHICLSTSKLGCQIAGVSCWLIWAMVCARYRRVFVNPFEYWIHQLVGLDLLLEGFNPLHEGFGFYWCALAFWLVLICYHIFANSNVKRLAESHPTEFL